MSKLIFQQYEMTRGFFIETVKSVSREIADIQPEGFNNTIRWHIGHVLIITEELVGFPYGRTDALPVNYFELFGRGTKPTDWKGKIPSLDELVLQLKDQLVRLQHIPAERLNMTLAEPFGGFETFEEIASLVLFHEGIHMGQIESMKRIIEHSSVKKSSHAVGDQ
ncbi:DinB family protein [Bacillus sp. V3-13]|uniref:DinB family protein n=1 Tax=Bacillus sp. V3-13 TaxID=2053728 RepID=UPI000C78072E|nr:DinB family protein [Bacillus sp. V3-13]PLR76538.1 DinB family protein [Bacillus sp. V3-13]